MAQKLNGNAPSTGKRGAAAKRTEAASVSSQETNTRTARHATAPAPSMSNVTDETLVDFYDRALDAKKGLEDAQKAVSSANGVYRGVLKEAKKAGIDPDDIIWRLNQRNRSPDEIDAETKRRNRIAKLTNLPIGTQLGMFDDGKTVATASENQTPKKPTHKPVTGEGLVDDSGNANAYNEGYAAAKAGKSLESNSHPKGSDERAQWDDGWSDYQQDQAAAAGAAQSGASGDVFSAQA